MIELRGARIERAGVTVLRDVDLRWEGGVLALTGPNGCGKSTLLRALCGALPLSAGTARVDGFDLATERALAQARCALVPEEPSYPGHLTVEAIARLCADLRGAPTPDDARSRATRGLLGARTYETLSLGQRKRAHLLFARAGSPRWWLLDEPSNGLDADARADCWDEMREREGGCVVATHDPEWIARADGVAEVADRALRRAR